MGKKTELNRNLREFVQKVSSDIKITEMYLFGSRAWGKPRKDSDVDLLVVSSKFKKKQKLSRAPSLYLAWDLKYPVDFLCLTPEEFKEKQKIKWSLVNQIVKEGIKVV
ncbi:hypothetical protein COY27_02620 [Candidatus Woesearchaeota archaeon CG_4_10_14_0_2_um_filter_33_13]|nr:MAG: hypothetical protein COY27_02620 [Candidatus Woesearchaeota archaeon CG_4_10_14_0_2_um_filter_33_13]